MDYNMDSSALRVQLKRISDLMLELLFLTEHTSEEEFRKNEGLKEKTYFALQEIGQMAMEMDGYVQSDDMIDLPLEPLKALGGAMYNQEQEFGHLQVFNLIKNDFPLLQERIQTMLDTYSKET